MAGELRSRAQRYTADAARAFDRAPVEVTLCILLAVAFSYAVDLGDDAMRTFAETAAAVVLAATCAWSATLLHALGALGTRMRWSITVAGAALAAAYGIWFTDFERVAELWRACALLAAALCWLIALPAFAGARADATDRLRLLDGRIVLRTIGVLLYGLALFAGLALALGAINELFELDLSERIYAHVFGWVFIALVPWVIIGGLDDYIRPAMQQSQVASIAQRMLAFLVPPLLAIYYLILYAYGVRIGVTGEVPKNLVSPLVIAAGALAALSLLLFDPRPDDRATVRPLRVAAPLYLPAAALGVWAVVQRLDQYGWTEFRALRFIVLLACALLAAAATFQLLRRRRFTLHWLPAALAVVLVLAAVGPWSVLAVSRRSQQDRLGDALQQAGFARDGTGVRRDTMVAYATYEQIRSAAAYLIEHFGAAALPPALVAHARGERFVDIAARLGLRAVRPTDVMRGGIYARLPEGADVSTAEQPRTYYVTLLGGPRGRPGQDVPVSRTVRVAADGARVHIRVDTELVTADFTELAHILASARPDNVLPPSHARVPVTDAAGRVRGDILVLELDLAPASTGVMHVQRLTALLTLRD